jgi:hypothetical protein
MPHRGGCGRGNPAAAKAFGILARRPGRGEPRWRAGGHQPLGPFLQSNAETDDEAVTADLTAVLRAEMKVGDGA